MSEYLPGEPGIAQAELLSEHSVLSQDGVIDMPAVNLGIFDRLRNRWITGLATAAAALAIGEGPSFRAEPAYAADPTQATIGMPFQGKWAYVNKVTPPYTDANSSHPSVHNSYSFQWATDLYAGADTAVKLNGSSVQDTVTFKHIGTSDTCSSQGAGIGGSAATFGVYVGTTKVGEVKYEHLDLESDFTTADNDFFDSGTKIGEITTEPLNASCYQISHAHVQFKNTSNQSCYIDHGATGQTLAEGAGLGVLGSSNTTAKQSCSDSSGGGGGGGSLTHYADYMIYRYDPNTSTGYWYAKSSSHLDQTPVWGWAHGSAGDVPITADFDGDGYDDYGIYRVVNGTGYWYVRSGGDGKQIPSAWGIAHGGWSQDIPVAGDFDGDGRADFGIYRMESDSTGRWYVKSSKANNPNTPVWGWIHGSPGDTPVVGDMNGDNVDDYGIYRPNPNDSTGYWYFRNGGDGKATPVWGWTHGSPGDKPIVGDFNGDNVDDYGIYRIVNGTGSWYVRSGGDGKQINPAWGVTHGGWSQDIPLAGDFGRN